MTGRVLVVEESLTVRMRLCEVVEGSRLDPLGRESLAAALGELEARPVPLAVLGPSLPDATHSDALAALARAGVSRFVVLTDADDRRPGAVYLGAHPEEREIEAAVVAALARGGRKILVIDDSPTYRAQLREALEAADYVVIEADTGEAGLARLAHVQPDAVIVDGVLPGIDGPEVVRRIKSEFSLRHLPCCLLTAAESARDELRSLEAGADAHVRKSEDTGVLLARVAALLRHVPAALDDAHAGIAPRRLLAVDDSPTYLQQLGEVLRAEGYEVSLVTSGAEALARLERERFDAILLDLVMPELSGTETCRAIKRDADLRDIPLIMLTARDDRDAMIEGINAGADDYIAKSADFEVLKARLRAQIRRRHFEDENRRIRERLVRREAEERYLKLVHSNIIGVVFGSLDGRITDANDAFLALIGRDRRELEQNGLDLDALTPPEWRERNRLASQELLRTGAAPPYETEVFRADGSRLPVMLGRVLIEGTRESVGFVLDRTEHKRAEAQILAYTAALEEANRKLGHARDQAERMSQAKSAFLANMSHELRTPLNAIIGFAELLHDGVVTPAMPEHHEFLGDILRSGLHLLQLINDILDLSKVEAGKLEFRPRSLLLTSLVGEVLALLRPQATAKRIETTVDLDPGVEELFLDPHRLKQVLFNFVSNALKFTPDGGRVCVRARAESADRVRLEVEDDGIGIAPDDLERLFVDFQQLDSTLGKRHQGTGLGLALTRRLVQAQGGEVGVRSAVGVGSCFFAVLPRHHHAEGRTRDGGGIQDAKAPRTATTADQAHRGGHS